MAIAIAPNLTQRHCSWTVFKASKTAKNFVIQYEDDGEKYNIWAYDGPEVHITTIWKGILPYGVLAGGLTQENNDTYKTDFETNFKNTANAPIEPKTKDGRLAYRASATNRTTNFKLRVFSFTTGTGSSGIHNINPVTDASYGDVTLTMYDANGAVTTDPALAVKEYLDFMPAYDYEIIGGYMDIPTSLKDGTTNQWFLSVIGVPDLPPQNFGSLDYISEVNLEAVTTARVDSDGRAISYLPYNYGGYPTNKLRFIIKHPAGVQKRLQVYVEHFV